MPGPTAARPRPRRSPPAAQCGRKGLPSPGRGGPDSPVATWISVWAVPGATAFARVPIPLSALLASSSSIGYGRCKMPAFANSRAAVTRFCDLVRHRPALALRRPLASCLPSYGLDGLLGGHFVSADLYRVSCFCTHDLGLCRRHHLCHITLLCRHPDERGAKLLKPIRWNR